VGHYRYKNKLPFVLYPFVMLGYLAGLAIALAIIVEVFKMLLKWVGAT
jgi:hypothetical protein